MSDTPILIAGGGIGGLVAGLAIASSERPVTIVERAGKLEAVGAGLQLSPNAVHVLRGLGLEKEIRAVAFRPEAIRIMSARSGKDVARVPLGDVIEQRHGAPYLLIHRGDLQNILLSAVEAHSGINLRLGASVRDAKQDEAGVMVNLETLEGSDHLRAGALIGADGVWSTVRRRVMKMRQAAFTGRTAYRAVVQIDDVPAGWRNCTGLWLGAKAHVVHYPIRGGAMFNIVAIVQEQWDEEGWSTPADKNKLLPRFADWPKELVQLLDLPESWLKWALCAMEPGDIRVEGRVALLGDAGHAMLPFVAQGAAMAIEDAAVLASCLQAADDVASGFSEYEEARRERVDKVMRTASDNDRIYHLGYPASLARDAVLGRITVEKMLSRYDWLFGWKAE
ncbi:FAD-dependent monooxygenase [Rhizobiales bacterium]|uniref:FAD-dependent monooxygenase n=1 Tax=Hongsoonwoonella zoysiae TaxID=2821844 RepID=UPI00155FF51A|nr:FAD-dependent monooxygenase [Hongsoonwoonella zoysiae]NRG18109.1 FAD-dependent monooxygenase [Hongsoonwoonella zoysiae]